MPSEKVPARHDRRADTTEAVDEFMASLDHPHKGAILALRRIVLGVDPSVAEGVKWNAPSFRTTEYFATTHLRAKAGIGLILHLGAKVREGSPEGLGIQDPDGLLRWLANDRATLEFSGADDLERKEQAVASILRQWITRL